MLPVIKGIATDVRENKQRYVSYDKTHGTSVSYSYAMRLRLDGQPVQLTSHQPKHIEEGDEIAVSGPIWLGTMHGWGYKNISRGIPPRSDFVSSLIIAFALLIGSYFVTQPNLAQLGVTQFSSPFFADFFVYIRLGLRLMGGFALLLGLRGLLAFLSLRDV